MLRLVNIFIFGFLFVLFVSQQEARYLPTRSQDDRLTRLREILHDLLESEKEKKEEEYGGGGVENSNNDMKESLLQYDENNGYNLRVPQLKTKQIFKRATPLFVHHTQDRSINV